MAGTRRLAGPAMTLGAGAAPGAGCRGYRSDHRRNRGDGGLRAAAGALFANRPDLARQADPAGLDGGRHDGIFLGTDAFGRDILSRLIYGARVSLIVAVLALTAGGGVGLAIGIVAGYFGGMVDNVLMRLVDAAFTFPAILFALLLAVTMGQGLGTLVIAISLLLWASFARVIRGEVLSLEPARLRGARQGARLLVLRIMLTHILPKCSTPLWCWSRSISAW